MTKIEFINRMSQACNEAMERGARFNKEVIYAQAALESQWGNTELAQRANNLFAIKAGNSWPGETIRVTAAEWDPRLGWYSAATEWRKYQSWTECIIDYAQILAEAPWYQDALSALDNPKLFLQAILPNGSEPGWATDPDYYRKVLQIGSEIEELGGPKWV